VQITHRNSGLWFAERQWEICRLMISCKRQWPKFCTETLNKFFSNAKKRASRNIFRHFFHANFFMFVLLISNHTVFLVQPGTNLHLWAPQKAETALAEAARAISAFWKTHSCKSIPNWTRNRMITYTNTVHLSNTSGFVFGECKVATAVTFCIINDLFMLSVSSMIKNT